MTSNQIAKRLRDVGPVSVCALALAACDRAGTSAGSAEGSPIPGVRIVAPAADADQTYTTRGRIYNIPGGGPLEEFQIAHETIPDFVSMAGEVVGMNAMVMPFPAFTADAARTPFAEGDKVEFTFAVDWDGDPRWVVTALSVLPPDAEVDLAGVWPDTPPAELGDEPPAAAPGDD